MIVLLMSNIVAFISVLFRASITGSHISYVSPSAVTLVYTM